MDLKHTFTVNQPIAETWAVVTDLERIAPCLPGAQLQEVQGDVFKGIIKIKVGPIVAQFKGEAQFAEKDDTNYKATLKAAGRDTTGKGNASATISADLTALTPNTTSVTVVTDLAITGKVAQFGRGALSDISEKLIAQFADNLNTLIDREGGTPSASAATATATKAATKSATKTTPATAESKAAANGTSAGAEPAVRKIEGPAAEPLDLQSVAGEAMLKRLLPVLAGFIVLLWLLRRRK
ncbi:MAG: SRPBCC family protein [Ilumatobacteraceae bacterium]